MIYYNLSMIGSFLNNESSFLFTGRIQKRDQEIADLKSKMSEVMALMPPSSADAITMPSSGNSSPSPLYSTSSGQSQNTSENGMIKAKLNPHASEYKPKQI